MNFRHLLTPSDLCLRVKTWLRITVRVRVRHLVVVELMVKVSVGRHEMRNIGLSECPHKDSCTNVCVCVSVSTGRICASYYFCINNL